MNSRIERYNEEPKLSRTQKNEGIYSSLNISDLSRIKTNNNVSIISDAEKQIDIEKIKKYIYNEEEKEERERVKLDLSEESETKMERKDEKDYDIISVLQRAKSNRNIEDYENNRHRKVNETDYEVLKNIKIEKEQEEEIKEEDLNTEEKTIVDLIHTIAFNAGNNKEENDLFDELMSGNENTKVLPIISNHEIKPSLTEELKDVSAVEQITFNKIENERKTEETTKNKEVSDKSKKLEKTNEYSEEKTNEYSKEKIKENPKIEKIEPEKIEKNMPGVDKSFFTNSMSFSKDDFEGFDDMEKKVNKSNIFTKIAVLIIILLLIATIIVVLNYILELGWF